MLSRQFLREAEKNFPRPLYLLWSKDSLLLEDAVEQVRSRVIRTEQRDFNFDVFDSSSSPRDILDVAGSFPFIAVRRLIVVKEFHRFSAANIKALIPYLSNPSDSTCMVILSQKDHKSVTEAVWQSYRLYVGERDIPSWIRQRASGRGLRLTADAADFLIETAGTDLGLLASEIDKLALSGKRQIGKYDIIETTGMLREYTSFNLIDALVAGKKQKAFRILRLLMEKKPSDATSVLGPLNWHYRQFYSLWENRGKRPPKMRTSTQAALTKYLPRFTVEDFRAIFQSLHDADREIKSSGRPDLVMDLLLIRLLQAGSGS